MKRMTASTMSAGAITAAARLMVSGNARPIIPPPAAARTRKKVPSNSEKSRRHSWLGSLKSSIVLRVRSSMTVPRRTGRLGRSLPSWATGPPVHAATRTIYDL